MRCVAVLLVLALPLSAFAADRPAATSSPPPTVPVVKVFQLFSGLTSLPFLRLPDLPKPPDRISIRQAGDPDTVISPGKATPSNELALKPALEINDILLKAYAPRALVESREIRSAGTFSPLDEHGRPYQLRLGARLVW